MATPALYLSIAFAVAFIQVRICVSFTETFSIDCGNPCTCFGEYFQTGVGMTGYSSTEAPFPVGWKLSSTRIDCRSKNLSAIPNYSLSRVTNIRLSHNHITYLPRRKLQNYANITNLDLGFNAISRIDKEAFFGLSSLSSILLNNNRLKELPYELFSNLSGIFMIGLSFNNFEHFPQLNIISDDISISLDNNEIAEISVEDFPNGTKFWGLALSENKLRHFPSSLATFLEEQVRSYGYVVIGGNPWVCDCQMAELKRVWPNHPRFVYDSFYCHQPERLKDKNIWNIPTSELVCDNSTYDKQDDEFEAGENISHHKALLIGACVGCFAVGVISTLMAYFSVILMKKARRRLATRDSPFVRMEGMTD